MREDDRKEYKNEGVTFEEVLKLSSSFTWF